VGAANFIPELTVELYRHLVVEKDLDAARPSGTRSGHLPYPREHELRQRGEDQPANGRDPAGPTRLPVRLLDDETRKQLAAALATPASPDSHPDRFRLRVLVEGFQTVVATTEARFLVAAERRRYISLGEAVHRHGSRPDSTRDT